MSLVDLSNVVKRFGALTVLDEASLKVEQGEIVAIIGRSGSGKSTLLRCINGLEPIQAGRIVVDGTVVNEPGTDLRALRQLARFGIGHVLHHAGRQGDVALDREVREQVEALEDDADALAQGAQVGAGIVHHGAVESDGTSLNGLQPVHAAQHRALARARAADDGDDLALLDV